MLPVAPVTRCIADPFDRWTGVLRAVVNKTAVPSNGCRDHRDVFLSASDEQRDERSAPACRGPWGEPSSSLAPAILPMTCPSIARWRGTQASSVPWRITAGAPARVDAAIFARAIRLNEALRSHLFRDAVEDVALARVLGNGATAGTWDAAPAGVIVILAVLLDSACAGRYRCRGDGVVDEHRCDGGGGGEG